MATERVAGVRSAGPPKAEAEALTPARGARSAPPCQSMARFSNPDLATNCLHSLSAPRCELSAARSLVVAGAGHCGVAAFRSRLRPMAFAVLVCCTVLGLALGSP